MNANQRRTGSLAPKTRLRGVPSAGQRRDDAFRGRPSSMLLAAIVLAACSAPAKPLTDVELKDLVHSLTHPESRCVEDSGGMLISCGSGNAYGDVSIYVLQSDKNAIHVDGNIQADATTGGMMALNSYMQGIVGKLGMSAADYRECSNINASKKQTSSFKVESYDVDCTTFANNMLRFEMTFTRR